jgi:ABC-type bacteriocin/lantibiotic exporter with double-glycine peptidase domain
MIGAYYGLEASERKLAKAAGTTRESGTTIEGLAAAADSLGLVAASKEGSSYPDIRRWLAKGVPVIVNWFSVNTGHYSVAVLADAKHIHLNDPETGTARRFGLTIS